MKHLFFNGEKGVNIKKKEDVYITFAAFDKK